MFNKISVICVTIGLFATSLALAHGENKPGPNQGYVRMPGAFHTEVVPVGEEAFKVYLLDIGFKNPVSSNSAVSARLKQGASVVEATCAAAQEFFSCKLPTGSKLENGVLEIKANRLGSPGAAAHYKLPLSFTDMAH